MNAGLLHLCRDELVLSAVRLANTRRRMAGPSSGTEPHDIARRRCQDPQVHLFPAGWTAYHSRWLGPLSSASPSLSWIASSPVPSATRSRERLGKSEASTKALRYSKAFSRGGGRAGQLLPGGAVTRNQGHSIVVVSVGTMVAALSGSRSQVRVPPRSVRGPVRHLWLFSQRLGGGAFRGPHGASPTENARAAPWSRMCRWPIDAAGKGRTRASVRQRRAVGPALAQGHGPLRTTPQRT